MAQSPETAGRPASAPAAPPSSTPDAPCADAPHTGPPRPGPTTLPPTRPDGSRQTAPPSTPSRPPTDRRSTTVTRHDHPGGATSGCYTHPRVAQAEPKQIATPGPSHAATATRHLQRTDRGHQRPARTPPRLRPRLPQPHQLHRPIPTRNRRLPTSARPSYAMNPLCAWSSWPRKPATDTGSIRTPCINQGRGSTGVGHT
jgi:hypothetical protein